MKINGLLSEPFTLIMLVILQEFPLSMFLYIAATKVVAHFSDNDMGLKVGDQETQTGDQEIKIVKFVDDEHFLRWNQLLCQAQAHFDTIREVFQLKNKLSKHREL